MSGPMCGPTLDPRPKSWKSVSVPKGGNATPMENVGGGERCTYRDNGILC